MGRPGLCWISLFVVILGVKLSSAQEERLVHKLLDNYDNLGTGARPISNVSAPINVNISFSLLQILEFDQMEQVLTLVGWTCLQWVDMYLTWNPEEYLGQEKAVLIPDHVWTPDIVLFNSVEPPKYIHQTRLLVGWQGNVTWVNELRYRINCKTHPLENSPACELRFGSWAYDETQLSLTSPSDRIDAKFYVEHHIWELSRNKALAGKVTYPHHPGLTFDDVNFEFELQRRPEEMDDDEDEESGAVSTLCHCQHGLMLFMALFSLVLGNVIGRVR